jgi:hypothetical protein
MTSEERRCADRVRAALGAPISDADRARRTGYYWIIFRYDNGSPRRWEPAGWDADALAWAVIGSRDMWLTSQLEDVGPAIGDAPPIAPRINIS